MTRIKLCGLTREEDIVAVNELRPEYIGFVFWTKSKRYVTPDKARQLREKLIPEIISVGVFVDESAENIASLVKTGIIGCVQLHGSESDEYIAHLRGLVTVPIIRAFRVSTPADIEKAEKSTADMVLLDSGTGSGVSFDWSLLTTAKRPYFLAGGLSCDNVTKAVSNLRPYAVDVSSGIETDGVKDKDKMKRFVYAVRNS
ncbi:MAG: phosphoribosylanthranilate isomerase [Clostridia bacterium]|nr:phosphoribosylanthranilate isomerase [Clostridia bacterium]